MVPNPRLRQVKQLAQDHTAREYIKIHMGYILVREEVFCLTLLTFLFSSYSSQRNTHSPLSKDTGITKKKNIIIKLTLQTSLMTCKTNKKINISVITALCANFPSTGPSCIRHTRMPWLGCFPAPGLGPPAQDISRGPM